MIHNFSIENENFQTKLYNKRKKNKKYLHAYIKILHEKVLL